MTDSPSDTSDFAADLSGPLADPRDHDPVFPLHKGGKIEVRPTVRVRDRAGLSLAYTPGVARVSEAIADRVLALPMHGYMRDDVAHRIGSAVRTAIVG